MFSELSAPSIGFTATPLDNKAYSVGEQVIFDQIYSNIGGAYNASSNTFTCPVTGVYVFTARVTSLGGLMAGLLIQKDGEGIGVCLADTGPTGHRSAASTSVVTECTAGQAVWIESTTISNIHSGKVTSFSGFLLNHY